MRVLVLGAAGAMGAMAAHHIARNPAVRALVLTDLHAGRLQRVASTIGDVDCTVAVAECDVLDPVALRRLLDRADVVVNCAGPFFRLGVPTLRAAIETATAYLDICDDPEPTLDMLALDDAARAAGVPAVIGMGASPGLSNLLALRAAGRLDTVADCYTGWALDDASPAPRTDEDDRAGARGTPSGAVLHFMEQIHGAVYVVEDGALVRRPPLEAFALDFPGMGRGTGYLVGHPEPITLRTSLGITGRCVNLVLLHDGTTAAYLKGLQRDLDAKALDRAEAGRLLLSPSASRSAVALAEGVSFTGRGALPPFFALVRGTKDGVPTTIGCHVTTLPRGMAGATAVPAALAVAQLIDTAPPAGVHAPEAVIDADRLLRDLLPHCAEHVEDVDRLAPLTGEPSP